MTVGTCSPLPAAMADTLRNCALTIDCWPPVTGQPRGGDWPKVRLHVVTGKGGTGKTTVAAALALALASGGGRVLLMEVEGRQGIAQLFDTPPLPYEERLVAVAPDGGEVFALAVDPEGSAAGLPRNVLQHAPGGTALRKLGAIDFATTIAPGVRDVLLTGKAIEAVKRGERAGKPVYDAVVMDAPRLAGLRDSSTSRARSLGWRSGTYQVAV